MTPPMTTPTSRTTLQLQPPTVQLQRNSTEFKTSTYCTSHDHVLHCKRMLPAWADNTDGPVPMLVMLSLASCRKRQGRPENRATPWSCCCRPWPWLCHGADAGGRPCKQAFEAHLGPSTIFWRSGGYRKTSNLRNGPSMMLMMLAPAACIISIIGTPFDQFGGIKLQPFSFFVYLMMAFGWHQEATN